MNTVEIKRASISSLIIWVVGVSAFVGSYYFPLLDNADEQANLILTIALIPAIIIGVYMYNMSGVQSNGLQLAGYMFLLTMILDALITVPFFIVPAGGDYLSFFLDSGFWILGIIYLLLVFTTNWLFRRPLRTVSD